MSLVPQRKIGEFKGNLGDNHTTGQPSFNNTLTLTDYQDISSETAIYPGKGTLYGLMYVGLGLGESGEVQGKIKKIFRDDLNHREVVNPQTYNAERVEAIKGELGDVLWYVAQTATELGLDLGDIALSNIEKLQSRKERGVLGGSGDNR